MSRPFVRSGIVEQPAGWNMGFHTHESFEISVVLEGKGIFESQDHRFLIESGHVVMIPANIAHSYRAETDIRFGVVEAGEMPADTQILFDRLTRYQGPSVQLLSPIILEHYEGLFRQWLRMISLPLQDEQRSITTWVDLLILFLLQYQNSGSINITVASTADHIRSNLRSEISIHELAKQCMLSESAYRSLFKEVHGLSPKQYQQHCRLSEAKWLLRTTNRPIQVIAGQVGYSGVHAFSAWFQKIEGHSPSYWRSLQKSVPI